MSQPKYAEEVPTPVIIPKGNSRVVWIRVGGR